MLFITVPSVFVRVWEIALYFLKIVMSYNLHFVYPLTHDADRNGTQVQSRRERSTWSSLVMRKGGHWLKGFYLRLGL